MALTDEKKEQELQCDNCTDGNSAATRCEECALFLCSYCSGFHKKSRPTTHHVLATLQELKSGAGPLSVAEKIRCKRHREELIKLFCKTCQSTICRDCTIVEHRTHDYGFIEDVAVGQKEILKRNMKEVQQRQAVLQRGIASLKLFDQSLVDENALIVAQVTSHFEALQRMVVSRKNELLSKASASTKLKRKQIQAQIETLEVALASCKSSIEFTEKAFKNGNDAQVLSMQKYMLQSLEDLKKVKDVTKPCVSRDLTFSIPWSIEDTETNFLSYFAVDESMADPDQCQAEFIDQGVHLKRDEPNTLKITCFDKNKTRVKHGGQVVKAQISGVECDDTMIQDNKDGTHTITFTPRRGGMLKFEGTIDGRPAPKCSLIKDVTWVFSSDYGRGELSDGGIRLTNDDAFSLEACWRIGECSFKTGLHTWKVLVNGKLESKVQNQKFRNQNIVGSNTRLFKKTRSNCSVGVAVSTDIRGRTYTREVRCRHDEEVTVTVTLNIPTANLHFEIESSNSPFVRDDLNLMYMKTHEYERRETRRWETQCRETQCRVTQCRETQFWPLVEYSGDDIEVSLKFD